MSDIQLHQQNDQPSSVQDTYLWRMRWFFAFLLAFWLMVSVMAPIIVFCLTRSPISLTLFSVIAPPVVLLYRFLKFLLPMNEDEIDLARQRIQRDIEINRVKYAEKLYRLSPQDLYSSNNEADIHGPSE